MIGVVVTGAWLLTAGDLAVYDYMDAVYYDYHCPWDQMRRSLAQVDGSPHVKHFTQEIESPGLGRVLSEGYSAEDV